MDWKLTTDLCGEPFVSPMGETDDEDLTPGFSVLRALAEADHTLTEVGPGAWWYGSAEGVVYLPKDEGGESRG